MRRLHSQPPTGINVDPAGRCQGRALRAAERSKTLDSLPPGIDSNLPAAASAAAAYEIENSSSVLAVRLGLRFLKGLPEEAGKRIENERARRPFADAADLARRCDLRAGELPLLAFAGALASLGLTRREALWQAAEVGRRAGPLYESLPPSPGAAPLPAMSAVEETEADYEATEMTAGPHLLSYLRETLARQGVLSAGELAKGTEGARVRAAGAVIVRQRPGTAKGFVFLTLEDETGIANIIVRPDLFQSDRATVIGAPFLLVEGILQNVDGVTSVKAERVERLGELPAAESHDFY